MKTHIEHLAAMEQMHSQKAGGGGYKRKRAIISSMVSTSLILFMLVGIATMATSAGPNNNLYPVKRTLERIHSMFTFEPLDKAELETNHAETRLDEITAMAREGQAGRTTGLFVDFEHHINAAEGYRLQAAAINHDTRELKARITSLVALRDNMLIQFAEKKREGS